MCGIAGIVSRDEINLDLLKQMILNIQHRGPDANNARIYDFETKIQQPAETQLASVHIFQIGLAHARLSIVDLSKQANQPFEYDNRYALTFNGEIYNYRELRDELKSLGFVFKTNSDTEVVIVAYIAWGVNCLSKFNGMWAFFLFDKKTGRVFISRDRFGKKPFYYSLENQNFVFSSEIKSFLGNENMPRNVSIQKQRSYLNSGPSEWNDETFISGILKLPPASYIDCSLDELVTDPIIKMYWELRPNLSSEKFNNRKAVELAKKYYEILESAVALRMPDEVNFGITLSGGLDSSSILYLISEKLRNSGEKKIPFTFSSVYSAEQTKFCDESYFINLIIKKINCQSYFIEPDAYKIFDEINQFSYFLDSPPENTLMSSWFTYGLAKSHDVKVLIEGQGADEILAGYEVYFMYTLAQNNILVSLYDGIISWGNVAQKKWIILGVAFSLLKALFGLTFSQKIVTLLKIKNSPYENLNTVLMNSLSNPLQNLLHYADRGSMGNSIESRMPFLDYRLVEFLASVPPCYKLYNGWTKYLARIAFSGKLPDEIVWRKGKKGWPAPENFWFKGNLKKLSDSLIMERFGTNELILKNIYEKNFSKYLRMYLLCVHKKIFNIT